MKYADERLLLQSLKEGEEDSYIYLIDKYNQRLFGYAITLTNNHALAEDILQNVFLKTWSNRKRLHITSSLLNYLYRSVQNEFINQYKKQKSTMILERKYYESLEKAVEFNDEKELNKILNLVTAEINNLPKKCREIFILSRQEGLTNLEISQHLDISVKTVEAQVTKAFKTLRKQLGDSYKTFLFLLFGHRIV